MNAQTDTNHTDPHRTPPPPGEVRDTRPAAEIRASQTEPGIGTLLRSLAHEVPLLLGKEVALAKCEMKQNLESARNGAIAMAIGGGVLLAGFIFLLLSAVYALSYVVDPWLAALIVGGSVVVIGLVMLVAGKKQLEADSLRPDRTMDSLQKDRDAMRRSTP